MPVTVSYPGVYVEELPSGQHTVTGVATSITAFLGRAVMGPSDDPRVLTSYADYERLYGGLAYGYPMSYAVRDFFLNGGSQAVVVRLFEKPDGDATGTAQINVTALPIPVTWYDEARRAALAVAKAVALAQPDTASKPSTPAQPSAPDAGTSKPTSSRRAVAASPPADPSASTTPSDSGAGDAPAPANPAPSAPAPAPSSSSDTTLATTDLAYLAGAAQKSVETFPAVTLQSGASESDVLGYIRRQAAQMVLDATQQAAGAAGATRDGVITVARAAANRFATINTTGNTTVQLSLVAANQGAWGNRITAKVIRQGITEVPPAYQRYGLTEDDLFHLQISYRAPGGRTVIEQFPNVTVMDTPAPNRLDRVLASQSQFVRVATKDGKPDLPHTTPTDGATGVGVGGLDSQPLLPLTYMGSADQKTGMYALNKTDLFNMLCIPPDGGSTSDTDLGVYNEAAKLCHDRRAILIVDPPNDWANKARMGQISDINPTDLQINGEVGRNVAVYFPRVIKADPELNGHEDVFPACGMIAGVIAATDVERGVWKAPAGLDAGLNGLTRLEVNLTDAENGLLNPKGINSLRSLPLVGPVIWGARTLRGADMLSDDYKYLPVRRLTLYIEESLYRNTQWAVFEPNDQTLWLSLGRSIDSFMADLARQGAFYGYKIVCDKTTTSQYDIDRGIVNVLVSFAPVKPAEFVVLMIQQAAGQAA